MIIISKKYWQDMKNFFGKISVKFKRFLLKNKTNLSLYSTRRITSKCITSLWCPSSHHIKAPRRHSYLGRCWNDGESFAMLCKNWPAFGIRNKMNLVQT